MLKPERIDTAIIGGGQSGLSVGYQLAQRGLPFVILDANARVGDAWRNRWDSLRLFTPARYDGLAGMPFPAPRRSFPTKDEMADYLEAYAQKFALPVRTNVRVERITRSRDGFLVTAGDTTLESRNVVVAMANFQRPRVPAFASGLNADIAQLHSLDYRGPQQLRDGAVLIVGAGNSGAEIALETVRDGRRTWVSGRDTGHVPFRIDSRIALDVLVPIIFRVVFHRVLSRATPIGRKASIGANAHGGPLIRVKPRQLAAAGVERVGRTVGTRDGKPLLDDGRTLDVGNVIWCTGFDPGFSWIDLPVFDANGDPVHRRGVAPGAPGLYFVGLHFLYAMSSTMIHGVERDAAYVASAIADRARQLAS
jgi:putative flavoprotein involved in K+ transport